MMTAEVDTMSHRAAQNPSGAPTPEHDPDFDPAALLTQAFWDDRYGSKPQIWAPRRPGSSPKALIRDATNTFATGSVSHNASAAARSRSPSSLAGSDRCLTRNMISA